MPETKNGRDKIIQYLTINDISISALATMYGETRQNMADYLSGRKRTQKQIK